MQPQQSYWRKLVIGIFLVFCNALSLKAQNPYYINYSVNNGLPSSEAYCVIQDKKGYIWVSTDAGIACFDGYKFKTYTTQQGLADNTIFAMVEDHQGRIWCVGHSGRACYFKDDKFYSLPCNDSLVKKIGSSHAFAMDVDTLNNVYINSRDFGVFKIKPPYRAQDLSIVKKADGGIGHNHTLVKFGRSYMVIRALINKATHVVIENGRGQHQFPKKVRAYIYTRCCEGGGYIYYSCDNIIYRSDGARLIDSVTIASPVISLCADKKGNLWAGTLQQGLYFFQKGNLRQAPRNYFKQESISFIMEDAEKGIWFTSLKNSLFYMPYPGVINFLEKSFLEINRINAVVACADRIVAGKSNGDLLLVNPVSMQDSVIERKKNVKPGFKTGTAIVNLAVKGKDTVIVMGQRSFMYNPRKNQHLGFFVQKVGPSELPLFSKDCGWYDGKHFFLVGTSQISFLEKAFLQARFVFYPSRINSVKSVGKSLWVGTHEGLWLLKDSVLYNYGDSLPPLKHRIDKIEILSNGHFLLATKAAGLLIWDPVKKKINSITVQQGLPGNTCRNIFIENDSIIWLSTNKGLSKINIQTRKVLFNYTMEHGLPSNEVNAAYVDGAYIWIATSHGLCCVNKKESFTNTTRPYIYITGLKINAKKTALNEEETILEEQPDQLSFTFAGITYKSLGKCIYKYKLQGLHDRWYYTRTPLIEFSSLDPGQYTLEVYAINNSGISSLFPARLRFTVPKLFWQKAWFQLLVLLLFLLLVFFIFRIRLNLVRKRAAREASLNRSLLNLKLKALRAQMNPHFTFNVMNSIQHFIVEKDDESAQRYLAKFSKLIRVILQHSEEDTIPLSEEIKALELYLELEVLRFEQRFDYEIKVDPAIAVNSVMIPSMLIQPYVENAIKHGILPLKRKGMIRIIIENQPTALKCIVEDNGVGRMQAATRRQHAEHKSMGTSITKERLSVINALNNMELSEKTIDLEDENGHALGTRVEILIPV